jgi:2-polyprenyl-3-methyl-5-hydroxy-6-metoxy-1,4-benzoquinol methylase
MRACHQTFAEGLADIPGINLLPGGDLPLWSEVMAQDRDGVERLLAAHDIGSMRLPDNLSRSPHLKTIGHFPNSERFEAHALILPSGPQLTDAEIATVLDTLRAHADRCRLCGEGVIADLRSSQLPGASSDDKPRPACPPLTVCQSCGHVQKMVSPAWQEEIRRIYAQYDMYQNADGEEPLILGAGLPRGRSDALLQALGDLPPTGRLLDFGCGHGAFIKTIQQVHPGWTAAGFDSNPSYREEVMAIPGVESYDIENLPDGPFDLITAIYVMEHVTQPVQTLLALKARLNDDGRLMFVVPHFVYNAFDLMVVDHLSHFTRSAVAQLAQRAGFEVEAIHEDCIPRALVVILKPGMTALPCPEIPSLDGSLGWLCEVRKQLEKLGEVGVFGTGTASAWCTGVLDERVQFYVDEAANRVGREHLGKPILAPAQVPNDTTVYLGLPLDVARRIGERLAEFACDVILPPDALGVDHA